jgi:hypothetical protein
MSNLTLLKKPSLNLPATKTPPKRPQQTIIISSNRKKPEEAKTPSTCLDDTSKRTRPQKHRPLSRRISVQNIILTRTIDNPSSFFPDPLVRAIRKISRHEVKLSYLKEAQVARVCGLVLPAWRFACFSPGERSSSVGLDDDLLLLLLEGVNFLSRVDMELVVEELRTEAVSAEGFLSEAEDWVEDIFVVDVVGGGIEGLEEVVMSFDGNDSIGLKCVD